MKHVGVLALWLLAYSLEPFICSAQVRDTGQMGVQAQYIGLHEQRDLECATTCHHAVLFRVYSCCSLVEYQGSETRITTHPVDAWKTPKS